MTDHEELHGATNELLDAVQEIGWTVEHYQLDSDAYDDSTLSIELKFIPGGVDVVETDGSEEQRNQITTLTDIISDHEGDSPAERSTVITEAVDETGMDAEQAQDKLNRLEMMGDVYEPKPDYLRTI